MDGSIFTENFANLNTSISNEKTWATGINWYLNHNVKLAFDFEQTKFRRGAVNGASTDDRKTENLIYHHVSGWFLIYKKLGKI